MSARPTLTEAERAVLGQLADAIAPGTATMPSASEIGIARPGGLLDRVLEVRPDLVHELRAALDAMTPPAVPPGLPGWRVDRRRGAMQSSTASNRLTLYDFTHCPFRAPR